MLKLLLIIFFLVTSAVLHAQVDFEVHSLNIATAKHQTVLSGFLFENSTDSNSRADLIVATVSADDDRSLNIFRFEDQAWRSVIEIPVRKQVIFIDLINIAGVDRILLYERGKLNILDPSSGQETLLHAVQSIYNVAIEKKLPQIEISKDYNHDGMEDLAIPGFEGYRILLQKTDGTFSEPLVVGPPTMMNITIEDNPWYQPRSMYPTDFNQDGRDDLVFWNDGVFEVYPQKGDGGFSLTRHKYASEVIFDSDGLYSIELGENGQENDSEQKVLFALDDLNGDGISDLMTFKLEGQSLFGKKSTYEIHRGYIAADGNTAFPAEAHTSISSRGLQFDIQKHDFDADGQKDMLVLSVDLGLGKIIAALLTGSSSIDLGFYKMREGIYPEKPNVTRKLKVEFNLSTGDAFVPSVLIADVTGDGRSDLLIQQGRAALRVYEGIEGAGLFSNTYQKFDLVMPDDENSVLLAELDSDNREDLILHFKSSTEPGRLVLMLAR